MKKYKEKKIVKNTSSTLINYFLVIGYDDYNDNIPIKKIIGCTKDGNEYEYEYISKGNQKKPYYPTILANISSIESKDKIIMLKEDLIIRQIFPSPPSIIQESTGKKKTGGKEDPFFAFGFAELLALRNKDEPIISYSVVFSYNNTTIENNLKKQYYGYAYVFYEADDTKNYPKAFCVISEYPYFQFYKGMMKGILKAFKNEKINIPLEVFITNVVNYLPSPINSPYVIKFNTVNDIDIETSEEKSEDKMRNTVAVMMASKHIENSPQMIKQSVEEIKEVKINQCYCFPYFDFNISDILYIFPPKTLMKIIFVQQLELDMVVFSEHIEILNVVLFILSKLSFPFEQSNYSKNIYCISKAEFRNPKSLFMTQPFRSVLGVNCKFDSQLVKNKNVVVVDIDTSSIIVEPSLQIYSLYKHFSNIIDDDKAIKKNSKITMLLFKNIFLKALEYFDPIYKNIIKSMKSKPFSIKNIFFSAKEIKTESNYNIQNVFYTLNLSILHIFYSFFRFESTIEDFIKENKKIKTTYNKYTIECDENFFDYTKEEVDFLKLYKNTDKYFLFFHQYLKNKGNMNNFLLQFIFTETFLGVSLPSSSINYLKIMKDYSQSVYHSSDTFDMKEISFEEFHKFYMKNIKTQIIDEMKINIEGSFKSKQNSHKDEHKNEDKHLYSYASTMLNMNIVKRYILLLDNFPRETTANIFPSFSERIPFEIDNNIWNFGHRSIFSISYTSVVIQASTLLLMEIISELSDMETNVINFITKFSINMSQLKAVLCIIIYNYYSQIEKIYEEMHGYKMEKELFFYQLILGQIKKLKIIPNWFLFELIEKYSLIESRNLTLITVTRPEEIVVPTDTNAKKSNNEKKINIIISGKFTQSKDEIKKYIIDLVHNCKEEDELYIPYTKNKECFYMDLLIPGCQKVFSSEIFSPHKLMSMILELIYEMPRQDIDNKQKKKTIKSIITNLVFYYDSLPELNKMNYDFLINYLTEKMI